jgi:hypothetical protein
MILTSYAVIKKDFDGSSASPKLIVIPRSSACQAHGSAGALTRIMKAVVLGKFNKQFFWEEILCYCAA